mgnify:CR=1 FL=1
MLTKKKNSDNTNTTDNKKCKIINCKITAICLTIVVVLTILSYVKYLSSSTDKGTLIGYANNKKIYDTEILGFLDNLYGLPANFNFDSISKDQKIALIKQLYAEQSMLDEAEKLNITKNTEVAKKITQATTKIIKEYYLNEISKDAITRDNIEKSYQEYVTSIAGKTEVKAQHILVKTEDEAKKIINDLKTQPFTEVAKQKSLDSFSKQNGGDLGYFTQGRMVKQFEDQVFEMKVGTISSPFQTQYGWHVVKLLDKREAKAAPLDDMYEKLKRELSFKTINDHINKIKDTIEIKLVETENTTTPSPASKEKDEG